MFLGCAAQLTVELCRFVGLCEVQILQDLLIGMPSSSRFHSTVYRKSATCHSSARLSRGLKRSRSVPTVSLILKGSRRSSMRLVSPIRNIDFCCVFCSSMKTLFGKSPIRMSIVSRSTTSIPAIVCCGHVAQFLSLLNFTYPGHRLSGSSSGLSQLHCAHSFSTSCSCSNVSASLLRGFYLRPTEKLCDNDNDNDTLK